MRPDKEPQHFIANRDGTFVCDRCWTKKEAKSISRDDCELWNTYSAGWTGPVHCHRCLLNLPIYITEVSEETSPSPKSNVEIIISITVH